MSEQAAAQPVNGGSTRVYTFADFEVGQPIDPVVRQITEPLVRDYLEATGEPAGAPLQAPPSMVTLFTIGLTERSASGGASGGIHARQEYVFLAPLRIGATITTRAVVAEKYVRNGRNTVVLDTTSTDEQGIEVARCRVTQIVPN